MNWDNLKDIMPLELVAEFIDSMHKYEINTTNRSSHFLSQCSHESAHFTKFSENLNYSSVGLIGTFPKYFQDKATADHYARQPEKIANRVYANRIGNGDEAGGDGWKYRGKGAIQLTGKANYVAFGLAVKEDVSANPDLLLKPKYIALSACWFFSKSGLNQIADKGTDERVIKEITKRINGGYNGLTERIKLFKEVYSKLNSNGIKAG